LAAGIFNEFMWNKRNKKDITIFITENGYDGTSVEQIANIVGIKAPSLYKHLLMN
jgi:AcrR family transcriptional regulator